MLDFFSMCDFLKKTSNILNLHDVKTSYIPTIKTSREI